VTEPGTYTLAIALKTPVEVAIGAAGTFVFEAELLAYTGSAFGPGGLDRVDRHRQVATRKRDTRHWHVDHVLGHEYTRLEAAWVTPGERVECEVHQALPGREVPIGASDCSCRGHLRSGERGRLAAAFHEEHSRRVELDTSRSANP
jgi:endonuclease-3